LKFLSFTRGTENLQRIGRVIHISPNGNIIVKAENVPRLGDKVLDENLRTVGIVFDVVGPVSSPYVAVKPKNGEAETLVGKILYATPSKRKKGR